MNIIETQVTGRNNRIAKDFEIHASDADQFDSVATIDEGDDDLAVLRREDVFLLREMETKTVVAFYSVVLKEYAELHEAYVVPEWRREEMAMP